MREEGMTWLWVCEPLSLALSRGQRLCLPSLCEQVALPRKLFTHNCYRH